MFELYKHLNILAKMHEYINDKTDGIYRNHRTFKGHAMMLIGVFFLPAAFVRGRSDICVVDAHELKAVAMVTYHAPSKLF